MAEIGSAFITIAPSMRGFDTKLNAQAGGTLRTSGKSLGAVFGKAFVLGGAVIAAAGIGSFLKGSIEEAREAQKVGALTANVIKTTGGAAKISAKQVGDLATALSLKTGVDDEAIQSGSNLLLTFKNIKREGKGLNDVFGRATAAAVDLSASGFGDINGASKQLGKALNDPVKGITALGRSGVTFSEDQKALIKSLVESGDNLGAQKIILKEVESQVGGAAAATSTYGEKASVAFGNIKEQVGTKLLPVIDSLAKTFLKAVPTITRLIDGIGPAFRRARAFLAPFIAQVQGFFSGGGGKGFISGISGTVSTLRANFLPVLRTAATTFQTVVLPAITALATYLVTKLTPIFTQVSNIVTTKLIPIIGRLATFFYGTLYPAVVQIVTAIAGSLKPVFDQLFATFSAKVLPALDKLFTAFQKNQPAIQKVVLVVVKVVGAVLRLAAAILGKVLPILIRFNAFVITKVIGSLTRLVSAIGPTVTAIKRIGDTFVAGIKDIGEFVTAVKDKIARVKAIIEKLPDKIVTAIGDLSGLLVEAGKAVITGLIKGIGSKLGALKDKLEGVTKFIPKHKGPIAKDAVLLTPAGEAIMQSLINGIEHGKKKLKSTLESVTDAVREKVDGLKSDFASLSDSVGSNLTGSLFSGFETAGDFLKNLTTVRGNLGAAVGDLKVLQGFGLSSKFLAQLFSEGGFPLIHELASNKDQAAAAGSLFGDIQSLSTSLGNSVAQADVGPKLDEQTKLLQELVTLGKGSPAAIGRTINGAATAGKRRGNRGGKGKR